MIRRYTPHLGCPGFKSTSRQGEKISQVWSFIKLDQDESWTESFFFFLFQTHNHVTMQIQVLQ